MKKTIAYFLSLIMAVTIVVGVDYSFSYAVTNITSASATIIEPVGNATPDYSAETPEDANYSASVTGWYKGTTILASAKLSDSDTFEAGQTYTAVVSFAPISTDYSFYEATYTVNGKNASYYSYSTIDGSQNRTISFVAAEPSVPQDNIIDSGTCGDDATWTLTSEGLLEISGTGTITRGNWTTSSVGGYNTSVNKIVMGEGITTISTRAFYGFRNLKEVVFPDGLKRIEESGFLSCDQLENVSLPEGFEYLGDHAFCGCKKLENIALPEGLEWIGSGAFQESIITTLTIPSTVTYLSPEFNDDCYYLDKMILLRKELYSQNTIHNIIMMIGGLDYRNQPHEDLRYVDVYVRCDADNKQAVYNYLKTAYIGNPQHPDAQGPASDHFFEFHDTISHEGRTATCTEKGWAEYETCTRCDYSSYKEISPLGHDVILHEAKAATCTESGWKEYETCSRCDYNTYEETLPLGHDLTTVEAKAATCTESGWEEYETCSRCDYNTEHETLPALGHTWKHYTNAAGYLKNGNEYDQCDVCDDVINMKTLSGYSTFYVKKFKVSKGKKAFTAKWKKQSKANQKKFNGYQIRYSINADMSGAKYATASKKSKSKKIKKLNKKTRYYVQVRTYTVSGGQTFYSNWSAKKSVKTK